MTDSETPPPSYLRPLNPQLKLRLEDVVLTENGEAKVIVTADDAIASKAKALLEADLKNVTITDLGDKKFAISAFYPMVRGAPPDKATMVGLADTSIINLSQVAALDVPFICKPAFFQEESNILPAVRISFNGATPPSKDFGRLLECILLNLLEQPSIPPVDGQTILETLGVVNTTGVRLEPKVINGTTDYVLCDLDIPPACQNMQLAKATAQKFIEQVSTTLGITDASRSVTPP